MVQHRFAALAAAVFLAAPFAGTASAQATSSARAGQAQAPSITALEVNADAGLQPGSVLRFKLQGTPKGKARVQVAGSKLVLDLPEAQPGVYTGSYTVRRDEKGLTAASLIRTQLTVAGRTQTVDYGFPPSFGARQAGGSAQAPNLRIDSFTSPLVDKAIPGTELRFTVEGTPAAKVSVQVPGLKDAIELREERPGRYAGTYVLRRDDAVKAGPAVATLRSGEKVVTAKLGHSLSEPAAATAKPAASAPQGPLTISMIEPRHGAVLDVPELTVRGQTTPNVDVNVRVDVVPVAVQDRASVAQTVLQTTAKADARGYFRVPLQNVQRPDPGTQVQVLVAASRGNERTPEQRMVVIQR